MWYAIIATDKPDSLEYRKKNRPAHLDRLEKLKDQGRLLLAGPHPAIDNPEPGPAGFSGSLVIAEFDSWDDAKAWANLDPYLTGGVYQDVQVKPFKKILP